MKVVTDAIILATKKIGENALLIHAVTPDNGRLSGSARISSKKNAIDIFSIGNLLKIQHFAKEESLGKVVGEPIKTYAFRNLSNKFNLYAITAICGFVDHLIYHCRGEFEYGNIFYNMVDFFELLEKHAADNDNNARLFYFIMVTKHILSYVGYGFSLDKCVATGDCDIETLKYLSPRTASAISEQAAKPYLDVVLKLPRFFTTEDISDVGCGDLLCGFNIITYFFIKIIREHLHINDTPSYWQKVQDFFTQSN